MGKGQKPNAAEERELFETGELGDHSPEALIRTVWFFLTMHLGMRGRDEHTKLKFGDFQHTIDENGEYIQWCFERGSKTRTSEVAGCINSAIKQKCILKVTMHCPVKFFKAYLSHRPLSSNYTDSPFFLEDLAMTRFGISMLQWGKILSVNS